MIKGRIAIYLRDLVGGGVERMMLNLANELIDRGYSLDIVLERPEGEFFDKAPAKARLIFLSQQDLIPQEASLEIRRTKHRVKIIFAKIFHRLLQFTGNQYRFYIFKIWRQDYLNQRFSLKYGWQYYNYLIKLPYLTYTNKITNLLCKYLSEEQPETVITGLEEQNFRLIIAGQLTDTNARLILSVRNHLTTFFPLYYNKSTHKHYAWAIKNFYRKAHQVIAVSKEIERDLIENFGIPDTKTTVIYNPVVNQEILFRANETTPDDDWLHGELPVVLGVGRLHPQKGFDSLLNAFSIVVKEKKARLMILGSGPEEESLKELTSELGLNDLVKFPGFRENPFPYMKHCAVFVLSSVNEGLPGVLIQAMACGCPIVATDCRSGPREILENGELGALVPVGDPDAMAKAILISLDGEMDTPKLIERAGYFNAERATEQYIQLIQTV